MTQKAQILSYMKQGKTITPLEALTKFGCMRLAARIYEISMSYDVRVEKIKDGDKTYARYSLVTE